MERVFIDMVGTALEIFVAIMYFETFRPFKTISRNRLIVGISLIGILSVTLTTLLINTVALPILSIALMFGLSFYFDSSITFKLLHTCVISAALFAAEVLVGTIYVQILAIPTHYIRYITSAYMIGVIVSKLFVLLLVFLIRIPMKQKWETERQFNLLMAVMPIHAIIVCFIVYGYTLDSSAIQDSALGIIAVVLSLTLLVITMFILYNQRKVLSYKREYDISQAIISMQIEHYQELYNAQHNVKSIRHEMNNNLIALSGALKTGQTQEVIKRIDSIQNSLVETSFLASTGIPPVDAVIAAKKAKANENKIEIIHKVLIADVIEVDQFDLAILIANALDNAIEGILRADDVSRQVILNMTNVADYITLHVENYASASVRSDFKTSKSDKKNHGFGLMQMRSIAAKYNGDMYPRYNLETGKFTLSVLLRNHKM